MTLTIPGTVRVDPPEEREPGRSPTGEAEAVLTRLLRQARREYAALLHEARACGAALVAKSRHVARLEGDLAILGVAVEQEPAAGEAEEGAP
jgi:hypothetical protein